MKILIFGIVVSGKTTLARKLSITIYSIIKRYLKERLGIEKSNYKPTLHIKNI